MKYMKYAQGTSCRDTFGSTCLLLAKPAMEMRVQVSLESYIYKRDVYDSNI
jgi:hypothetical protein